MKDRPILFSAPMVRAILDGRKTQARRVVKGVRMFSAEHDARWNPHVIPPGGACPDSWSWWEGPAHGPSMYHEAACPYGRPGDRLCVRETWKYADRITLEITGVRVERLQDISTKDCWEDGIASSPDVDPAHEYRDLWESINGPGSWAANPWVWVIEFKRAAQAKGE